LYPTPRDPRRGRSPHPALRTTRWPSTTTTTSARCTPWSGAVCGTTWAATTSERAKWSKWTGEPLQM